MQDKIQEFALTHGVTPQVYLQYEPMMMVTTIRVRIPEALRPGNPISIYGDDDIVTATSPTVRVPSLDFKYAITDDFIAQSQNILGFLATDIAKNLKGISAHYDPFEIAELIVYSIEIEQRRSRLAVGGYINSNSYNLNNSYYSSGYILPAKARVSIPRTTRKFSSHLDVLKQWLKGIDIL